MLMVHTIGHRMNAEWPYSVQQFSNGHHSMHTHTRALTCACMHACTYTPSGPIHPSHSNDLKESNEEERQGGGRLVQQLHQVHPIAKHKLKADHQVDITDNG